MPTPGRRATTLCLTVETDDGPRPLSFEMRRMINAGFVGRDQAAVKAHIDELAAEGIAPPPRVPMLFPVLRSALAVDDAIEVVGDRTSGEAEFVLLVDRDGLYVGIGSDHTDRALEAVDMLASKQVCANVLGSRVWPYEAVVDHWDDLLIESWTAGDDGREAPYQSAALSKLLSAEDLLALVRSRWGAPAEAGTVIYGGTVPILGGRTIFGRTFRCELRDPVRGRSIQCAYVVERLDDLT